MAKCGRGAFLFHTDKQAVQCNRALTIVPNQTCARCPRIASSKRCIVRSRPLTVNPIPPGKCQIARERCPKATNGEAAKLPRLCHPQLFGMRTPVGANHNERATQHRGRGSGPLSEEGISERVLLSRLTGPYSCHGKGEGQYVGVGEKDIGRASCSSWA